MKNIFSFVLTGVAFFVFSSSCHALTMMQKGPTPIVPITTTAAPPIPISDVNILVPPTKIIVPENIEITPIIGDENRPPDPLEKNTMPPDDFGKQGASIPNESETSRPPDPLEKNAMPPDDFGIRGASFRLVNEITKGAENEQAKEPGKLEAPVPRILETFSEDDLAKPEIVTVFTKDIKEAMPGVKNIAVEKNSVKVSYEREAKVLGFVPVKYQLTAEGDSETGKVTMKKPWWLIFAKNDAGKFQTAFDDSKDTIGELGEITSLKLQMDMDRRAKILSTLSNIMTKITKTEEAIVGNIK